MPANSSVAPPNRRARRHPDAAPAARRWASVGDTADYLKVTTRALRLMVADGRLTQYTLGPGIKRFDLNEVDAALTPTRSQAQK